MAGEHPRRQRQEQRSEPDRAGLNAMKLDRRSPPERRRLCNLAREGCDQSTSSNCSKTLIATGDRDILTPSPAPAGNPDPACAPTPTGTPTPTRTPAPARVPTPTGMPPAPSAATPAAATGSAPAAMPTRPVAPSMNGPEIGRSGQGGESKGNNHQQPACHRTLLFRPISIRPRGRLPVVFLRWLDRRESRNFRSNFPRGSNDFGVR